MSGQLRQRLQVHRTSDVSISQSRCFSFQDDAPTALAECTHHGFNLAIERLFSSGLDADVNLDIQVSFQSRNRDAFHFRELQAQHHALWDYSFNLAIERLFILVNLAKAESRFIQVSISQSRCFSVQGKDRARAYRALSCVSISQSRCFSCQGLASTGRPAR